MLTHERHFDFPAAGLVPQHPAATRTGSRLLRYRRPPRRPSFTDLPGLLAPGDLLVFNDPRHPRPAVRAEGSGGQVEF